MAIVLNDGYLLEGNAGNATQVDYTVTGLDGTTLKMLASGQLGNSKATLYTASGVDTIAGITLFNTGAATAVNLYINDGTSRQVVGIDSLGSGYHALFDGGKLMVYDENGQPIGISDEIEEITTVASSATPTPTGGSLRNFFSVTALAEAAAFAAPSGTPSNSNKLIIRIKDNGTARALTWNAIYNAIGIYLPTTTVISTVMYMALIYNSATSEWDCLAVN